MFELFIFTNGIFMGILLLIKPSAIKRANVFLALFLISLSLELLPDFFEEDTYLFPETSFFTVPLLYLYARQVIHSKLKPGEWFWLLPGILVNFLIIFLGDHDPTQTFLVLMMIPFYGLNLYLLISLHKKINKHQKQLLDQYTNLETRTLKWIRGLVVIFLIFHFVWILDDSLLIMDVDFPILAFLAELLTLLSVFWVGYFGLSQKNTELSADESSTKNSPDHTRENEKGEFQEVLVQIEAHRLYLNQELTLRLLAQQVGINEKKLSFWINVFTENNFYHLINRYRISEFKRQLDLPENSNLSLLGIAQNSGFRNKSTFYKVFKELEGITPNDYKKELSST